MIRPRFGACVSCDPDVSVRKRHNQQPRFCRAFSACRSFLRLPRPRIRRLPDQRWGDRVLAIRCSRSPEPSQSSVKRHHWHRERRRGARGRAPSLSGVPRPLRLPRMGSCRTATRDSARLRDMDPQINRKTGIIFAPLYRMVHGVPCGTREQAWLIPPACYQSPITIH